MKWIEALKIYNAGKTWCVPRKGTPEHAEVMRIMNRTKPAEVERRNVERREKAIEQLKALDTRKKIEERREADKKKAEEKDKKREVEIADIKKFGKEVGLFRQSEGRQRKFDIDGRADGGYFIVVETAFSHENYNQFDNKKKLIAYVRKLKGWNTWWKKNQ